MDTKLICQEFSYFFLGTGKPICKITFLCQTQSLHAQNPALVSTRSNDWRKSQTWANHCSLYCSLYCIDLRVPRDLSAPWKRPQNFRDKITAALITKFVVVPMRNLPRDSTIQAITSFKSTSSFQSQNFRRKIVHNLMQITIWSTGKSKRSYFKSAANNFVQLIDIICIDRG